LEDIAASLGCDWRELNREKLLEWAERLLRVLMTDTLEFENFEQDWLKMERDRQVSDARHNSNPLGWHDHRALQKYPFGYY
jgi:hypothetical protein